MSKILFFSPHDLPSSHISRNFDFAKRLVRRGHAVTVIANNFSHRDKTSIVPKGQTYYSVDNVDGVEVIWLNTLKYQKNDYRRAINALGYLLLSIIFCIRKFGRVDYCIGDSVPPVAGLSAYVTSVLKRGKFIFQVRDVWPIALVYDGALKKNSSSYFILRLLEIFLYKHSHKIYSTIPLLASHAVSSGAKLQDIVYVPNGVDLQVIKSINKENRTQTFTVTYAGAFGNAHDVESIIRAAKILQSKNVDFIYKFYGEGIKLDHCKNLADRLSLNNIRFYGSINKSKLSDVYAESDVLVAAVTDSDAYKFGLNLNKVYDYLAAGRPIVLACRSDHRPVDDARCGYTIDPERPDLMASRLLDISRMSCDERRKLGALGRKYAEDNYDLDKLVLTFEENLS
jgi:glycosyltransferase involved in cell wall biosynthesis